jgi:hypothetical protein
MTRQRERPDQAAAQRIPLPIVKLPALAHKPGLVRRWPSFPDGPQHSLWHLSRPDQRPSINRGIVDRSAGLDELHARRWIIDRIKFRAGHTGARLLRQPFKNLAQ